MGNSAPETSSGREPRAQMRLISKKREVVGRVDDDNEKPTVPGDAGDTRIG